jgi:hypothetical protein
MNRSSALCRSAAAALIALLLTLRLIGATGYMPALEHGTVAIVVCPDADANAPLALGDAHHHHGKAKHNHGTCPYASASAPGALGTNFGMLLGVLILGAALLLGRPFRFLERHRRHERPLLRGPPLPA